MEIPSSKEKTNKEKLIYKTYSICPKCALIDRSGLDWQPAVVTEKNEKIYLKVECKIHKTFTTLYCSNAEFFYKTMSYSFELKGAEIPSKDPSIENLANKMKYSPQSTNLPLAMELPLWANGDFVQNDELKKTITHFKSLYPPNRQFALKILGKGAMDINKLNEKVIFVESIVPGTIVILETTYERLILLCKHQESCFLKQNIYPALKYYLRQGDEDQCRQELLTLFEYLKSFTGIQLMVTLCLSRPYPTLNDILRFIREQHGFIRLVVISMERSPKEIVESLPQYNGNVEMKVDNGENLSTVETIDIYELLEHLQSSSHYSISIDDFYPMSLAAMMEPFLNLMGYGFYFSRPSPFCGFVTCLVNTDKSFTSYPVTRLFDFGKLFNELKPLLPRLQDGKIGLVNAKKLKKMFDNCQNQNKGPLPDLYTYLTDKSKAEETRNFIQNLQFVVVHNNMDIAAVDMSRRCNCAVGTTSSLNPQNIASYCTGCI